ncbi:hypothetical protein H920_18971 [Fukomys damarensis]|uniref:Uncharacterized protein n=1 Tax=Fukomys damarensis TaxID=885580 RepID=A0A091CQS7_FUKDA|nr:hypothetical protein H920_18971 [Fukomys damarensis]
MRSFCPCTAVTTLSMEERRFPVASTVPSLCGTRPDHTRLVGTGLAPSTRPAELHELTELSSTVCCPGAPEITTLARSQFRVQWYFKSTLKFMTSTGPQDDPYSPSVSTLPSPWTVLVPPACPAMNNSGYFADEKSDFQCPRHRGLTAADDNSLRVLEWLA